MTSYGEALEQGRDHNLRLRWRGIKRRNKKALECELTRLYPQTGRSLYLKQREALIEGWDACLKWLEEQGE